MHLRYRTVIFIWVCLLLCGRIQAQEQHHFVYIQSEKGQPFYIKHNGKVLSSTERGYIIIPQLDKGTTPITVGFPQAGGGESQFYLKIAKNDQGYLLKKSGETGYSLYDLQTFREIKSGDETAATAAAPPEAADNIVPELDTARKEMMSNLQKDLETTFADKAIVTGPDRHDEPAKTSSSFASALDKVVVSSPDRNVLPVEAAPVAVAPVETPVAAETPVVKKSKGRKRRGERAPLTEEEQAILSEVLAEEGKTAAMEAAEEGANTVPAAEPVKKKKKHKARSGDPDFIEFQDDNAQPADPVAAAPAPIVAPEVTDVPVTQEEERPSRKKKKRSKLFDDTEHPANIITDSSGYGVAYASPAASEDEPVKNRKRKKHRDEEAAATVDAAGAPVGAEVTPDIAADEPVARKKKPADARLINTDCTNIMNEATFHKLLRKFVAAKSDDGMIDVFRKQTRNYCLETSQVKILGQLLTGDDTRYRLLDLAYSKTYDTEKYSSLENLLTDNYYKGRFKAMVHK